MKPGKETKVKDFKGTVKKIMISFKKYRFHMIVIFTCSILSTIFTIIGPKVLGNATTEVFNGIISKISGGDGINFTKLNNILLTILFMYIISLLFSYIEGIVMAKISTKYTKDLREKINKKINKLPLKNFEKKNNGDILSLITNDIDVINQTLNQSATSIITSITSIIGMFIMMLSINVSMTLITVIILPISLIISGFFIKSSGKYFSERQENLASVNSKVEEALTNHIIVKAFNKEEKIIDEFNIENEKLYISTYKSNFIGGLMHPIMTFIGNLGYVIVAILGGINVINGKITVGNIQSFITYTKNFTQPIASLASVFTDMQAMVASSERVFEFLELKEEAEVVNRVKLDNVIGNVKFENVSFGYTEDKIIIKNFSADIKEGMKVAIVGPTGAGKTTLVKLLMRFYDSYEGNISIDDINIKNIDRQELRSKIGMVLQDTWLFNGTIMENLRYGNINATDDEVINAAKTAYIHRFIQTLPGKYDMAINEDTSNISEGQKQLLTIARAILSNPKILVLDEATSSVDTRTEVLIQKAMDELMKDRTSFIIAHRLSTIKNADLILVLDKGNIVEQGNHKELLSKNGYYCKLYNSQFEEV